MTAKLGMGIGILGYQTSILSFIYSLSMSQLANFKFICMTNEALFVGKSVKICFSQKKLLHVDGKI